MRKIFEKPIPNVSQQAVLNAAEPLIRSEFLGEALTPLLHEILPVTSNLEASNQQNESLSDDGMTFDESDATPNLSEFDTTTSTSEQDASKELQIVPNHLEVNKEGEKTCFFNGNITEASSNHGVSDESQESTTNHQLNAPNTNETIGSSAVGSHASSEKEIDANFVEVAAVNDIQVEDPLANDIQIKEEGENDDANRLVVFGDNDPLLDKVLNTVEYSQCYDNDDDIMIQQFGDNSMFKPVIDKYALKANDEISANAPFRISVRIHMFMSS